MCKEMVLVNPTKAIMIPRHGADAWISYISNDENLHPLECTYRKSGLSPGTFAAPRIPQDQVRATRYNKYISRQPACKAELLRAQLCIEILDFNGAHHSFLPPLIIKGIQERAGIITELAEVQDPDNELQPGQWRTSLQDGLWRNRIILQPPLTTDMYRVFNAANGAHLCIGGLHKTISITCPSDAHFAGGAMRAAIASEAADAAEL